jgi:hypothetical protein
MRTVVPRRGLALTILTLVSLLLASCILGRGPVKPAITITSPRNGDQVVVGQEVWVQSLALDDAGIARIELQVDGLPERIDAPQASQNATSVEMAQSWTPATAGRHTLSVRAFNNAGVASDPATIVVEAAPAGSAVAILPSPTATEVIIPTHTPAPTPTIADCMNNASFVADVTVPDDTNFKPGEVFDKVWRMRNSGSCPWEAGYTWVYESGDQMGDNTLSEVPPTIPGADADIRVTLTAPGEPGRYISRWRMRDMNNQPFGQRATVVINVLPSDLSAPTTPADLGAEQLDAGSVRLTWTDTSDNEQGFHVYTADQTTRLLTIDAADITEAVVTDLSCDAEVGFVVAAFNEAGESPVSIAATIKTAPCDENLPVIHYFRAEPETIDPGGSVVLSWDLTNALEARLFPGGEGGIVAPGSMTVSPTATTLYRLVATNASGSVEQKTTVTVRSVAAAAPQIEISASAQTVGEQEPFQITVIGREAGGLSAIWWWGANVDDPELKSLHAFECQGLKECQETWDIKTSVSGILVFSATGRSTAGVQAEQAGSLPTVSVRVVPELYRADGIKQSERQCLDLETGAIVGCEDAASDVRWIQDPVDGWMLQGAHGATLASLGNYGALDSVGYQAAAGASSFQGQALIGANLGGGVLLAARTNEGRLSKILVRSATADELLIDLVTYLE